MRDGERLHWSLLPSPLVVYSTMVAAVVNNIFWHHTQKTAGIKKKREERKVVLIETIFDSVLGMACSFRRMRASTIQRFGIFVEV